MAKRSWPFGVTSWDDTVKFAQLLFGVDVAFENYAERLPHRSNKSFLLFAKGACAEGKGPSSRLEISLRHSWKRFNVGNKMFATTMLVQRNRSRC